MYQSRWLAGTLTELLKEWLTRFNEPSAVNASF
jgi:hypothetical protein